MYVFLRDLADPGSVPCISAEGSALRGQATQFAPVREQPWAQGPALRSTLSSREAIMGQGAAGGSPGSEWPSSLGWNRRFFPFGSCPEGAAWGGGEGFSGRGRDFAAFWSSEATPDS